LEPAVLQSLRARRIPKGRGGIIDWLAAVLASPKPRGASRPALEDSREMRLVSKAASYGDLAYLLIATGQQGTRTRKPQSHDVGMRRHAETELESPGEVALAQPRHGGQFLDPDGRFEMDEDMVDHPSRLPRRESLNRASGRDADHTILKQFERNANVALRDVCILVESKACTPEKFHGDRNGLFPLRWVVHGLEPRCRISALLGGQAIANGTRHPLIGRAIFQPLERAGLGSSFRRV
jgi:hypothetical protein